MILSNLICDYKTRLVPIIGYPMDHSNAAYTYNTLYEIYRMNKIMFPVEIRPEELPDFIQAAHAFHLDSFILTMPLKAAVIPYLDEVDECSRIFRSVNTVKIVDGKTYGIGMDGRGCISALLSAGAQLKDKTVVLLGAGSISGAIMYELIQQKVGRIILLNRTLSKAEDIAAVIEKNWGQRVETYASTPENLDRFGCIADIFIQCSPLGMYGFPEDHPYLGFVEKLPKDCIVLDCPVNPEFTTLLTRARSCGLKVVPGMYMMLGQLAEIFSFCYDVHPASEDLDECRKNLVAYLDLLKAKKE